MSNFASDVDEGLGPVTWYKRGVAVRALCARRHPVSHRGTVRDTTGNLNQLPIMLLYFRGRSSGARTRATSIVFLRQCFSSQKQDGGTHCDAANRGDAMQPCHGTSHTCQFKVDSDPEQRPKPATSGHHAGQGLHPHGINVTAERGSPRHRGSTPAVAGHLQSRPVHMKDGPAMPRT